MNRTPPKKARLDADRTATPRTQIRAVLPNDLRVFTGTHCAVAYILVDLPEPPIR